MDELHCVLLKNVFSSFNLTPTISDVTRPSCNGGSCLDNIIILEEGCTESLVIKTVVSDHWAVLSKSLIKMSGTLHSVRTNKQVRIMKEENISNYIQELQNIDWNWMYHSYISLDEKVKFLLSQLSRLVNSVFPKKSLSGKLTKPKATKVKSKEIDDLKAKCEFYYDFYTSTGSNNFRNIYKNSKKELLKLVRQTRIKNNDNIIDGSKNKSKAMWNIIRKESGSRNMSLNKDTDQSGLTSSEFNNFFIGKVEEILSKVSMLPTNKDSTFYLQGYPKPSTTFKFHIVQVTDIEKYILNLSNSKCEDIYNLNSLVLKYGSIFLKEVLTHIINSCIIDCIFPNDFKFVKVVPIFKKGSKSSVENYRPISIIPIVSKVLEMVLNNQIVHYFEQNNLFSNSQFGYRSGLGTVKAATSFVRECIYRLENKEIVSVKLYDLSKAFDTVSHSLLLNKLKFYGFEKEAISLMKSYLSGRFQRVVFENKASNFLHVPQGVPQGSILGPILFIIYINDLPCSISSPCVNSYLFADDLSICFKSKSQELLDPVISCISDTVTDWCSANLLCVNSDKVQNLVVSYGKNNQNLEHKPSTVDFLGFKIDKSLCWEDHIHKLESKLSKGVYLIRRLRLSVSLRVLKNVYYAHINSHLSYGALLWGHRSSCGRLFKLQKLCVRLMCSLPYRGHCRSSFVELGIMTVSAIFILQCLLYVKENSHLYDALGSTHDYATRNRNCLGLIRCSYSKTQKTFYFMSVKFYNFLPYCIKQLPILKFKTLVRKILTNNCLYTIDEFFDIDFVHYV